MSQKKFKPGGRVLLTPTGQMLYGGGPANERPAQHDPSCPYLVAWDSLPKELNSYREVDLELARFTLVL